MAKHLTNPLQGTIDQIVKDHRKARQRANDSNVIPFGQEQLTRKQLGVRFQDATPEERKVIREKVGTEEILKSLGG